jgi:hypothetical protein
VCEVNARGLTRPMVGPPVWTAVAMQPSLDASGCHSADAVSGNGPRGATRQTGSSPKCCGRHTTCLSLRTHRERRRTQARAKPCLAARTYNASVRSSRSENDHERTHGRSPVWRGRYTLTHRSTRSENDPRPSHGRSPVWRADLRCSYERNLPSSTPRVAARLGWSFLITP